mmetsp:Transcript_64472/g.167576  ORF Transcript_64472/g.167576 Transcript_64472/m.167576 type:complete len:306 (-) Transcript_64472:143-1060(-)
MPCPACGKEPVGTEWKSDPLRWELDPPCSEAEWSYLADLPQAPAIMSEQKCAYMNNICRGCYSERLEVMARVKSRIRSKGGIEEMKPTRRMRQKWEEEHAHDLVGSRPAKIVGLQSATAVQLNGQYCKLLTKDAQTERWTVELITGEQKSIKESNLEVSKDIDSEYELAKGRFLFESMKAGPNAGGKKQADSEERRPLGQKTAWPKVKGIHPGAVVRLQGLTSAPEMNGRKGRCISFDPEVGRWKVDLGDEYKALKVDNLAPAPGEKPPTRQSAEEDKKAQVDTAARKAGMSAKELYAESYGWEG